MDIQATPVAAPVAGPNISSIEMKGSTPAPVAPEPVSAAPAADPAPSLDDLSSRFASLTRKERELFETKKRLKEREKELEAFESVKKRAKEDPDAYLKFGGVDFDEIIQMKLRAGEPVTVEDQVKSLEQKLLAMEKEKQDFAAKQETEMKQKRSSEAETQIKNTISQTLEKDKEKFGVLNALSDSGVQQVYEVMLNYYLETEGRPEEERQLSPAKAAELVEAESWEGLKKDATSLASVPKVRAFLTELLGVKNIDTKPLRIESETTPTLKNSSTAIGGGEERLPSDRDERLKIIASRLQKTWDSQRS